MPRDGERIATVGAREIDLKQYEIYEATIRFRRGPGYDVKPECEALDGTRHAFSVGWETDRELRPEYAGEWAMVPAEPTAVRALPIGWIASGDLVDIVKRVGKAPTSETKEG